MRLVASRDELGPPVDGVFDDIEPTCFRATSVSISHCFSQLMYLCAVRLQTEVEGIYSIQRPLGGCALLSWPLLPREVLVWTAPLGGRVVVPAGTVIELAGPAVPDTWELHWTTADGTLYVSCSEGCKRAEATLMTPIIG